MPPARRTRRPAAVVDSGPPIRTVQEGRSEKIAICIYGEPGIGKTRLVGTSAELGRTLILRPPVDHTDSIVDHTVDEWVIRDWGEFDDALLYLRNDGADKYDWVWLDSLSLWQDQGLDDLWEQIIKEKPHRARYGLDKGDIYINMSRIGRNIRHLVGCPHWHFGVTCHPRQAAITEDEEDDTQKLMPWVQGKNMPQKICGYMNMVGYYSLETVGKAKVEKRVLQLNQTERIYAKDQFSCTDTGRMIDPTMPKLWEAITATGEYKKLTSGATTGSGTQTRQRRAAAQRKR